MFDSVVVRRVGILVGLAVLGCDDGAQEETDRSAASEEERDAGTNKPRDAATKPRDASTSKADSSKPSECSLPDDCVDVDFRVAQLKACCTEEIKCGLSLEGASEDFKNTLTGALDLPKGQSCIDRERYFLTHEGSEEKRVVDEDGKEYLLTYECDTASILSFSFIGCCMPNSRCGVSTYGLYDTLGAFFPDGDPFTKPQCVSSDELNGQLKDSKLKGLSYVHDTDKACDYEGLDAKLTEAEPF